LGVRRLVNRITQNRDTIVLQYGQLGFTRTIHMNTTGIWLYQATM
jgi:hypothetical protein